MGVGEHDMRYLIILIFYFSVPSISSIAQDRKNYFPIWSYHQSNLNIHGISIGLGAFNFDPKNTFTNGIRVGLIGAGILAPLMPGDPTANDKEQFDKIMSSPLSERINGINLVGGGSMCDCKINGLSLGFIGHSTIQNNGISAAGFINYTQVHNGTQASIFSSGAYKMGGLQVGLFNNAKKSWGIQIGLVNDSEVMYGLQFGLWNVNQKRKLPIFNWNFKK